MFSIIADYPEVYPENLQIPGRLGFGKGQASGMVYDPTVARAN
jgi:hypothetical protein